MTTTTTTTTHVIIVSKRKLGILGKDQACLKAVARRRDHLKDNCTKVAFPGLLFSTYVGVFLVVFVYVPVLAKFKAVQWDDSLPTMDLCTLTASPFFFQFEEVIKCYESKLSTATILFSILAVGIFLGSLCFEALTSTAENGGVMWVWCHVCFGFFVLP